MLCPVVPALPSRAGCSGGSECCPGGRHAETVFPSFERDKKFKRKTLLEGLPAKQLLMVEVANPMAGGEYDNPATILVYRPWSPADLRDVAASLPDPEQDGGEEFTRVFRQIIDQYKPVG
ncbi:hypothetical protein DPEC_G00364910 [Dallia pectoralis]|nr:hypothetical protein DPEC_G00364910 [Dallia pectoralis]